MEDRKAFEPPPRRVREEVKSDKQDEFKSMRRTLRWAVAGILPSSIVGLAGIGCVVWAINTQRVVVWAVDRDNIGYENATRMHGAPLPHGGYLEAIEYWINDLRWISADPVLNETFRARAVARLNLEPSEKDTVMAQLAASLPPQTPQQTIISKPIGIEITPVAVIKGDGEEDDEAKSPSRRQWRVEWHEEVQDLSISADKLDIETRSYVADVITHEENPELNNFTRVQFEPMSVREVPNESR